MAIEQGIFELNNKFNFISHVEQTDSERFKEIITWAGEMMEYTIKERFINIQPKRGEIWIVDLGQNVGSEMNKVRPAIILSNDKINALTTLVTIVPISNRQVMHNTQYELKSEDFTHLESSITGTVVTEQIKSLSKARLFKKIGELTEEAFSNIQQCILIALGFKNDEPNNQEKVNLQEEVNYTK